MGSPALALTPTPSRAPGTRVAPGSSVPRYSWLPSGNWPGLAPNRRQLTPAGSLRSAIILRHLPPPFSPFPSSFSSLRCRIPTHRNRCLNHGFRNGGSVTFLLLPAQCGDGFIPRPPFQLINHSQPSATAFRSVVLATSVVELSSTLSLDPIPSTAPFPLPSQNSSWRPGPHLGPDPKLWLPREFPFLWEWKIWRCQRRWRKF